MTDRASEISRRQLLLTASAGLLVGATPARAAPPALIVVFANGGWDTSYTFDPKLGSDYVEGPESDPPDDPDDPDDAEELATYGGIRIAANAAKRPQVSAFFDAWSERALVINGVEAGGIAHAPNRHRVLAGTPDPSRPDLLSIVGSRSDPALPFGAVDLTGNCVPAELGAHVGRVGRQWQLRGLLDPASGGLGVGSTPDPVGDELVAAYLARRAPVATGPDAREWEASWAVASARAVALRARREELAALLAGRSKRLEDQMDLAAALIAGRWCRAVMVDSQQYFDTHSGNPRQHELNNRLFSGLLRLIDALDATSDLERTLVVVASEMTRSARRNQANGKDHWPSLSYLLVGGGVAGGRTLGGTDAWTSPRPMDLATGVPDDDAGEPCRYDNVTAGILDHLDIDPAPWVGAATPLRGLGSA